VKTFFIHFFNRSPDAEKNIHQFQKELSNLGFDEYHFLSTFKYPNEKWKKKAEQEIKNSDFVTFLFTKDASNDSTTDEPFKNVGTEVGYCKKYKKIIFLINCDCIEIPYDTDRDKMVDISMENLICFLKNPLNQEYDKINECIREIEKSYDIKTKPGHKSTLSNRIAINNAVQRNIEETLFSNEGRDMDAMVMQYQSLMGSVEELGNRRQSTGALYASINTAILALVASLIALGVGGQNYYLWLPVAIISVLGVFLNHSWKSIMESYHALNRAKFDTIWKIEEKLPMNVYRSEWIFMKSKDYKTASERDKLPNVLIWGFRILAVVGAIIFILSYLGII